MKTQYKIQTQDIKTFGQDLCKTDEQISLIIYGSNADLLNVGLCLFYFALHLWYKNISLLIAATKKTLVVVFVGLCNVDTEIFQYL